MRITLVLAALLAPGLSPLAAHAAEREFAISAGWAQVQVDGNDTGLDSQSGFRLEPRVSFAPSEAHPGLRLGLALGISYFRDEDENVEFDGFFDFDRFNEVLLFVPELQLSWRHHFSDKWFVEPGVAGGVLIADYASGLTTDFVFSDDFVEFDETEVGWSIRPFVRGGFVHEEWSFGIEGSWLFGEVDFGDEIGDRIEEAYIGLFCAFEF